MTKRHHLHAIIANITIALEYDPQDLAALTTLNAQIREAAKKLPGYRDIEIRLGKIPAPDGVTITEPLAPTIEPPVKVDLVENSKSLDIPGFLKK